MQGPHLRNKLDKVRRRDGAHQSESKFDTALIFKHARMCKRARCLLINLVKVGFDNTPELRETSICALSGEQNAAKFPFQVSNCSCQGRLRNVAKGGRTRKVQFFTHRPKISNLVHFHGEVTNAATMMDQREGRDGSMTIDLDEASPPGWQSPMAELLAPERPRFPRDGSRPMRRACVVAIIVQRRPASR